MPINTDLFFDFETKLEGEAKRISDLFFQMYSDKKIINITFHDAVKKYVKKEYLYYLYDISNKVLSYIPDDLMLDPNNKFIYINKHEGILLHIINYSNWCIQKKQLNKDPIIASKKFAKILIDMKKKNKIGSLSLMKILSDNISKLYPDHNDSIDAKSIVLYLQDSIENEGYKIEKIDPLKIIEVPKCLEEQDF